MYSKKHWKILGERYELIRPLELGDVNTQTHESWIALDSYNVEYLVRIWPFLAKDPNDLQRALWDTELRTMYRVSSSPGAEDALLVMREAGLDQTHKCFVMIMQALGVSGYETLNEILTKRAHYPWLSNANVDARRQLWMGLKQIAQGIQLLHSQYVLHRNMGLENVFLDPEHGPASFRLGGFEWSVRIGELHIKTPPEGWSSPPEYWNSSAFGYLHETDWYGFGMIAVRCLLNVEAHRKRNPQDRHGYIIKEINKATGKQLSDFEKLILQRLVDREGQDRLTRGYEIINAIDDLLRALNAVQDIPTTNPLVLVYNPKTNQTLIETAKEIGYIPNEKQSMEPFNPNDISHCIRLSDFVQKDLAEAQLYLVANEYILIGKQLGLKITRWGEYNRDTGKKLYNWDAAFCLDVRELRWNEGGPSFREIPPSSIIVRTNFDVLKEKTLLGRAQNWERYLPYSDKGAELRATLSQFHDFIRCTNQIELLMRDAELFQYTVIDRMIEPHEETIHVQEIERERPVMDFLKLEGGLIQFLQREIESNKPNCDLVMLDNEDGLRFPPGTIIMPKHCFRVVDFMSDHKTIIMKRAITEERLKSPPDKGWLRTFGMFGQIDLIRRRKEAIDRLANHSYLLRSLCATGQTFMDTGDTKLPQDLPIEKVDQAKQAAMRDVLRTRPIYSLQGPPGTGKTTMVAHLLRQIFKDDPVAQVLITAQAHGAVDVLRSKVVNEAFKGISENARPLAVRLGKNSYELGGREGSVENVAESILQLSLQRLDRIVPATSVQKQWRECSLEMIRAIRSRSTGAQVSEFIELVKRGANITYCTTSAGDLEELARTTQFYDWTIIEEAGKCHGFDLALPLHAGHRWLLIGDHYQLPPYRWEDYSKALNILGDVIENVNILPSKASGLLDSDWIHRWDSMDDQTQEKFKEFSHIWLNTFKKIFENCKAAPAGSSDPKETIGESIGAAAGMLSLQYRMHPAIGTLISEAYYDGKLKNQTVKEDGHPYDKVVIKVSIPEEVKGSSIVWIDTPSASSNSKAREIGPPDNKPRYTNPYEAKVIIGLLSKLRLDPAFIELLKSTNNKKKAMKLAILSPYNHQVRLIRQSLSGVGLPDGIIPKEALQTRKLDASGSRSPLVFTVDSFQGNEADIIIVSLVRNNMGITEYQRPLGFLQDPARMNVLLSRAQRLLILVGSWDFFSEQVAPFSLHDKTRRNEWHLKKVVTMLSDWFISGKAVKLQGDNYLGVQS